MHERHKDAISKDKKMNKADLMTDLVVSVSSRLKDSIWRIKVITSMEINENI